ncbi:MAG: phosphoribosyltransferase [Candidatus Bathyarchaeota archaeon]|nr:phosphoribosyltransferase [Candidatus Bathyarchaeota archaeon]MDW8039880.1 phosphoribosyltransferase [Nitrososphaerota archaeon]
MSQNVEFEVPTWSQIYRMLMRIAEKIRQDNFKPDVIVGVSRGGWPPARVLSDLLENPNLANVKVEFYVGVAETKGEPALTQPVSVKVANKKVLVVDEVADTGKSLQLIKEHLKAEGASDVRIATVYLKPWSIVKPDYYAKETSCWIVFPWEVKETLRKIVQKCKEKGRPLEEEIEKLVRAGLPRKLVEKFLREILEEYPC